MGVMGAKRVKVPYWPLRCDWCNKVAGTIYRRGSAKFEFVPWPLGGGRTGEPVTRSGLAAAIDAAEEYHPPCKRTGTHLRPEEREEA